MTYFRLHSTEADNVTRSNGEEFGPFYFCSVKCRGKFVRGQKLTGNRYDTEDRPAGDGSCDECNKVIE